MKYAVMSDVHANPAALATALADAEKQGCERFVLLGDITGYGYDAKTALELARERFDVILMGNHDSACAGLEPGWIMAACANYDIDRAQREELSAGELDWLRGLDCCAAERDVAFVHGDFIAPREWHYILTTEVAIRNFFAREERLLFCGHTHHAAIWEATAKGRFGPKLESRFRGSVDRPRSVAFNLGKGCRYIVNAGSVGYPRNDLCGTYAIYDSGKGRVEIRRLPFDFKSYIAEMARHGVEFPPWLRRLIATAQGANGS